MLGALDYADCLETFEGVREALEQVERRLAEELGLPARGIRKRLYAMARDGSLLETVTVADWHRRYAAYVDWVDDARAAGADPDGLLASDAGQAAPDAPPSPRSPGPPQGSQEAARAASCLS